MSTVECPYCNHEFEPDSFDSSTEDRQRCECPECGDAFALTVRIIYVFEASPAHCMNTDNHDWEPTVSWPKALTKMECCHCGEVREPTEQERNRYSIPSKQEYFDQLEKGGGE